MERENVSQSLQITLSELDDKIKEMLELIEEDGDTFAQRAEMYYKKRPELIKMVHEFHKLYRSLAERHDQYSRHESVRITHLGFGSDGKECNGNESNTDSTDASSDSSDISSNNSSDVPNMDVAYLDNFVDKDLLDEARETSSKEDVNYKSCENVNDGKAVTSSSQDRDNMLANLRSQVSMLVEDNLRQQSELIKRNDEQRQAIKDLSFHLHKVIDENKTLELCLRSSRSGGIKQKQSQLSKLKTMILRKFSAG